jgi:hypothetical protein
MKIITVQAFLAQLSGKPAPSADEHSLGGSKAGNQIFIFAPAPAVCHV